MSPSLVYGNLVGVVSLYCAARAARKIPDAHPTLVWLAQLRNARLLNDFPADSVMSGQPYSFWQTQLYQLRKFRRGQAIEMDREFTRSILCSDCSQRRSFANPGPRWHELFPATKDWREIKYDWELRTASSDDEEDSDEEDSDEDDSDEEDSAEEEDDADCDDKEEKKKCPQESRSDAVIRRLLTEAGYFKDVGEVNSQDGHHSGYSHCQCLECLKRARSKVQETFDSYKKEGMLRDFLKLYGIESDLPRDWVNPAAVARLYPAVEGYRRSRQDLEVIQLADLKKKSEMFYSEPLDVQKLAKSLEERQHSPKFSKLYEDWDLVVDGKAVSEGADTSTKVFVHSRRW